MKFLSPLLLSLTFLLHSCSSDFDVAIANNNVNLLGYWIATDVEFSGMSTVNATGQATQQYELSGQTLSTDLNIAFMQNPDIFVSNGGIVFELQTTGNGTTTTEETSNIDFFARSASWEREGTTISVTANDITQQYQIEELTPSRLVLTHQGSHTSTDETTGATTQMSLTSRIVFAK